MKSMENLELKCQKLLFCKSSLLMGPCYDITISGKQLFIKWDGWSDWDKFGTVGFLFRRPFKSNKKMMSVAL